MPDETPVDVDVNDADYDDPIVAELRQIRKEFSESFNGDMGAMARYFREQERLHPERMSTRMPRRIKPAAAGSTQRDS
jgi:Na+-transporting NADH:ubiquinone oxidoreductase subunit NqrA